MDTRPLNTDYSTPEWSWPSWKFDLPPEALFNDLYDQYNAINFPIQDPVAFHHDVSEICSTATTTAEFHALLRQRQQQRIEELRQCWNSVSIRIASYPPLLEGDKDEVSAAQRWSAFLHFSREFSFDALARYFSLFTHSTASSPLLHATSTSTSLSDEQLRSTTASETSTTPTQLRKRAPSSVTSFGDDDDAPPRLFKRLRAEQETSNNTMQRPSHETTSSSPTQSRKKAFSSVTSIGDGVNERLRPFKTACVEKEFLNSTKQRSSREAEPTFPTSIRSNKTPNLRRSSRIQARAQTACYGPPEVVDRYPTTTHSADTLRRRSQRRPMSRQRPR